MIITLKNLGVLKYAFFEPGKLTVLCGTNNTGKTYATYAFFGFLHEWRKYFHIDIEPAVIKVLLQDGAATIDLKPYIDKSDAIIQNGCKEYSNNIYHVFAATQKAFRESSFELQLGENELTTKSHYRSTYRTQSTELLNIELTSKYQLSLSLLVEQTNVKIDGNVISRIIEDNILEILFGDTFPHPFILSAERTGAAIFRRELNFARNRILDTILRASKKQTSIETFPSSFTEYALPVRLNVDFSRNLDAYVKSDSYVIEKYPGLIEEFSDLLGGSFSFDKDGLLSFIPVKGKKKLSLIESSSAVRSLLSLGFYLRHCAQKGDLLMIDEPELNLHPSNQRRITRLLASLVNMGINVFITTHSDYIINELSALIMLKENKKHLQRLIKNEKYNQDSLLDSDDIHAYVAKEALIDIPGNKRKSTCNTLVGAPVTLQNGITISSFDDTINSMNELQDKIIWGQ